VACGGALRHVVYDGWDLFTQRAEARTHLCEVLRVVLHSCVLIPCLQITVLIIVLSGPVDVLNLVHKHLTDRRDILPILDVGLSADPLEDDINPEDSIAESRVRDVTTGYRREKHQTLRNALQESRTHRDRRADARALSAVYLLSDVLAVHQIATGAVDVLVADGAFERKAARLRRRLVPEGCLDGAGKVRHIRCESTEVVREEIIHEIGNFSNGTAEEELTDGIAEHFAKVGTDVRWDRAGLEAEENVEHFRYAGGLVRDVTVGVHTEADEAEEKDDVQCLEEGNVPGLVRSRCNQRGR